MNVSFTSCWTPEKIISDVETNLIGEKVSWSEHFPAARDDYFGVIRGVVVTQTGVRLIVEITKKTTWWCKDRIEDHTPSSRTLTDVHCERVSLEGKS